MLRASGANPCEKSNRARYIGPPTSSLSPNFTSLVHGTWREVNSGDEGSGLDRANEVGSTVHRVCKEARTRPKIPPPLAVSCRGWLGGFRGRNRKLSKTTLHGTAQRTEHPELLQGEERAVLVTRVVSRES